MALQISDIDGTEDVEVLSAEVERARVAYEASKAAAEAAASAAQERREAALREFDQQIVDQFDESALVAVIREADARLRQAIVGGDWSEVRGAFVAVNVAHQRRAAATERFKGALTNLGIELHTRNMNGPTPLGGVAFDVIEQVLALEAARQADEAEEQVAQARMDTGDAAARGKR